MWLENLLLTTVAMEYSFPVFLLLSNGQGISCVLASMHLQLLSLITYALLSFEILEISFSGWPDSFVI